MMLFWQATSRLVNVQILRVPILHPLPALASLRVPGERLGTLPCIFWCMLEPLYQVAGCRAACGHTMWLQMWRSEGVAPHRLRRGRGRWTGPSGSTAAPARRRRPGPCSGARARGTPAPGHACTTLNLCKLFQQSTSHQVMTLLNPDCPLSWVQDHEEEDLPYLTHCSPKADPLL